MLSGAENPMQAPVAFNDFHVSVLTEEDGVIEVGWHFALREWSENKIQLFCRFHLNLFTFPFSLLQDTDTSNC